MPKSYTESDLLTKLTRDIQTAIIDVIEHHGIQNDDGMQDVAIALIRNCILALSQYDKTGMLQVFSEVWDIEAPKIQKTIQQIRAADKEGAN
jgi:hypothetical protein